MQTQNFDDQIVIRKASRSDEAELAELAYKSYYDRFFNDEVTQKYGASLKVYPELVPDEEKDTGQSRSTFVAYWQNAMQKLDATENPFICFVAEAQTPRGKKIVGFRKGYAAPLEIEEYALYEAENKRRAILRNKQNYFGVNFVQDVSPINLPEYSKIAGSSSLYVDPNYKRRKIGDRLIRRYAQEIIERDFEGMVTSCYVKNDSKFFLESMGAENFIPCPIPCTYRKQDKSLDICNIDGLMCLWDKKALNKLAGVNENTLFKSAKQINLSTIKYSVTQR